MSLAVSPVGDLPPNGTAALLVALTAFGVVAAIVYVSHRRNPDGESMSREDRERADANQKRHRALARYYLWAAAVGTVGLAVVGVLALMNE
jgi:ABC-type Fe3+ transport system permease subunit